MSNQTSPKITVIIPVYNASKYLEIALKSISNQTFSDFEVIAIDDCSTDDSFKILTDYALIDPRFKVFRNEKNFGVSATSNRAISIAKSKYIARMDADDLAHPTRLEKQFSFLTENPDYILVGAHVNIIDTDGEILRIKKFPISHEEISNTIYVVTPIQQPVMMINRTDLPTNFSWYDESLKTAEDLELFLRLLQYGKLANLDEVLLDYRTHPTNLSNKDPKETFRLSYRIRKDSERLNGISVPIKSRVILEIQRLLTLLIPSKLLYSVYFLIRKLVM